MKARISDKLKVVLSDPDASSEVLKYALRSSEKRATKKVVTVGNRSFVVKVKNLNTGTGT